MSTEDVRCLDSGFRTRSLSLNDWFQRQSALAWNLTTRPFHRSSWVGKALALAAESSLNWVKIKQNETAGRADPIRKFNYILRHRH